MTHAQRFERFKALHAGPVPLRLFNVWDAGTAKVVAAAGAPAVATSSWSVAAAWGLPDGQSLPFQTVLQVVEAICRSVAVPVSIDFESGYADHGAGIESHVRQLLERGVVGINLEDSDPVGGGLLASEDHAERIRAIKRVCDQEGAPLFVNARTDVFLGEADASRHGPLVGEAIRRGLAYASAGADGFFVPGAVDLSTIRRVAAAVPLPLNVMNDLESASADELMAAGVRRISAGPASWTAMRAHLTAACQTFGRA